ncbi:hypothetical protein PtA15_1A968 [Puccinia triticina]|uniref:glutathione gamma-glutamylcysteinyltransferase n=1 Tax=Puccinia triticina TaxID=208348 RepID=A0ABY7CBU6_9BASI|nr:uncharacterized protein PtA15_1A968 [Puccinia triticina]WAQ81626.1 hypothetical protein PtA15_1A968 [Puccinia triticina]WAR52514.1 hypothetical protein PtB15_1B956 [Puccinia triticina]
MFRTIFLRTTTKLGTSHHTIPRSYSAASCCSTGHQDIRLTKGINHSRTPINPTDQSTQNHIVYSNSMTEDKSDQSTHEIINPTRSFYQRQLPESCLSFTSDRGKALFRSALADGHLESFFPLASQLVTQHEPSFCGLATLCTVLNALGVDPKRVWKHPWRWFEQDMLDCCRPLESIRKNGITLAEFNCLARCNGLAKANCLTCNPNPPSITRINLNKSSWAILSRELSPILESVKAEPLSVGIQKIYAYISTSLAQIPNPIEIRPGVESEAESLFGQISSSAHLLDDGNHPEKLPPLLIVFALAVLPSHPLPLDLKFLEPELAYLRSQLHALGECCSLENDHEHPQEHRCECKTS